MLRNNNTITKGNHENFRLVSGTVLKTSRLGPASNVRTARYSKPHTAFGHSATFSTGAALSLPAAKMKKPAINKTPAVSILF